MNIFNRNWKNNNNFNKISLLTKIKLFNSLIKIYKIINFLYQNVSKENMLKNLKIIN